MPTDLVATALRKRDIERRTWNSLLIDIFRCSYVVFFARRSSHQLTLFPPSSVAHSQFILVYNFAQAILYDEKLKAQPALHKMMTTCFELFGALIFPRSA